MTERVACAKPGGPATLVLVVLFWALLLALGTGMIFHPKPPLYSVSRLSLDEVDPAGCNPESADERKDFRARLRSVG
jgi:hypothetical protein